MIGIKQCSDILNKNNKGYSDESVRRIRDFLYGAAELEYNIFKGMVKQSSIQVSEWKELSGNYYLARTMIIEFRKRGVKITATKQPVNFKSALWYTQLSAYLVGLEEA